MNRFLAMVVVAASLSAPGVLAQSPALYWLDQTDLLYRMDLDNRQAEAVFQIQLGPDNYGFNDIAIDSEQGNIYWVNRPADPAPWYLFRSDLLGTNIDTVFSSATASPPSVGVCYYPHQIAIDIPNNNLYWTFSIWGPDGICQADLTTGKTEQIIPAGNTAGIAIDPEGGKIYFSKPQGMIIRCDLDGAEPDTLAVGVPHSGDVFELDVALDTVNDRIYWATDDAVWRAGLDGRDAEVVVNGDFYWLAADGHSDSIFMTDSTGIYRSDLDGNGLERIVEQRWPGHLALYRPTVGTAAQGTGSVPEMFRLSQNFPNPFNPTTSISYDLPKASAVTLNVVDILGRQVRVLSSGMQPAGTYEISFDATGLPSGIYLYRLRAGDHAETKRMVVVR